MEASLVMSIVLFFIAALLLGIFDVHSRVAGNFVLQDALERCVFLEESGGETEVSGTAGVSGQIKKLEQDAEAQLRTFFHCGEAELEVKENENRKSGRIETPVCTEISVREYEPEETMRRQAVLLTGSRRLIRGSSLQERDEP